MVTRSSIGKLKCLRSFNRYSLELAFLNTSQIWLLHFKSDLTWRSGIFIVETSCSVTWAIVRAWSPSFFFKKKTFMWAHLEGFNFMWLFLAQSLNLSRWSYTTWDLSRDLVSIMVRSSTYFNVVRVLSVAASLNKVTNPSGPIRVPYGTPPLTFTHLLLCPLYLTHCPLPSRKFAIHAVTDGRTPRVANLLIKRLWSTKSKALLKSVITTELIWPGLSEFFSKVSISLIR